MPILVIIAFNCVIFALIFCVFLKQGRKSFVRTRKRQDIVLAIVRIFGVMVLFGLTWILGAFTIKGASLLFQWFFVICNTLQGVFIFLLFVVVNKNVQTEFKSYVSNHQGSLKFPSRGSKSYSVDTGTLKSLKSNSLSVDNDRKKTLDGTVTTKATEVSMQIETVSDDPSIEMKSMENTDGRKAADASMGMETESATKDTT